MHSVPKVIHEKISENEILMKFYMNMNKYKYNYLQLGSNETKISNKDIFVLGDINSIKMDITLYSMLATYFGVPPSAKIQEFHRIKASNEIFHAKSYRRVSKRFDCCLWKSNEWRYEIWVNQMFFKVYRVR